MIRLTGPIVMSAVVLVAGCTGETDPSRTNIGDTIVGVVGGGFNRQAEDAEARADQAISEANATEIRNQELEEQRAANAQALEQLRGEVASMRAEINDAEARLAGNAAATERLAALEQQTLAVERELNAGGDPTVARRELNQIRSAVRNLSS